MRISTSSNRREEFVREMARINKGRVFYTTPEGFGEYILVGYVAHKQKLVRGT